MERDIRSKPLARQNATRDLGVRRSASPTICTATCCPECRRTPRRALTAHWPRPYRSALPNPLG